MFIGCGSGRYSELGLVFRVFSCRCWILGVCAGLAFLGLGVVVVGLLFVVGCCWAVSCGLFILFRFFWFCVFFSFGFVYFLYAILFSIFFRVGSEFS